MLKKIFIWGAKGKYWGIVRNVSKNIVKRGTTRIEKTFWLLLKKPSEALKDLVGLLNRCKSVKKMRQFNIPRAEEWCQRPQLEKLEKKDLIPTKPKWVKVEFKNGVPYLTADTTYIWQVRPITRHVYNAWITQALEEDETLYWREGPRQSTS